MKILFTCMGGMSSSLIASKFRAFLEEKGYTVTFVGIEDEKSIRTVIESRSDYTIAYMHIFGLTVENRKRHGEVFDKVLIAPQSSYMMPKIIAESKAHGLKTDNIIKIPGKAYSGIASELLFDLVHDITV